ncbi:hypothetical protein ACCO45_013418 [Purpureocillium lilacinum]|uniref:Uncharacterized protein n=1 Tax=Purpureocillium lilacinum TaxID=33203 RepID=A0ACC4D867_PURLI
MRCQHGGDERLATETSALIPPSGTAREETKYVNGTSPRRFWAIFLLVLVIQFIGCFDTTITASSHPAITSYFGAAHLASWLSTSFLLTSTACQPFVGRLSDAVGRKPPFIVCLALFTAATAWCAVAGSIVSLILARALCGIGAGSLMTLGSIVTTDIIPIEKRGLYQPYTNIVYGGGCALGAALGGVMAETLGWRWEFGVQVPFLLLCIGISSVVIPEGMGLRGPSKGAWNAIKEFDGRGSVLLATATTALILGLSLGGNTLPWSHPAVVALLAAFAVCIPTFLWVESRCANPVVPLNLLFKPPRSNLLFANFIAAMLTHSILFNM